MKRKFGWGVALSDKLLSSTRKGNKIFIINKKLTDVISVES